MSTLGKLTTEIQKHGGEASFIANVIACHHSKPVTKLRGLLRLLVAGRNVRLASFDIDALLVDGERITWKSLEGGR